MCLQRLEAAGLVTGRLELSDDGEALLLYRSAASTAAVADASAA